VYHPSFQNLNTMLLALKISSTWPANEAQRRYFQGADKTSFEGSVGAGSLEKYGWLSDWEAENRLLGSSTRIDLSNEMASLGAAEKISSNGIAGAESHVNPLDGRGRVWWSGQLASVGVPKTMKILSSWLMSLFCPCKKGRRNKSSAKMQPTLHMSAAEEYS